MSSKITFLNDHWFWPIMAGAVILLGVFIWKELFIRGRRPLILKLLFSILAIGALAMIALKPALAIPGQDGKIALLTPGYEKSQLDSIKLIYPRLKVLEYSPENAIPNDIYNAGLVYILGNGIKDYDLQNFENIPSVHLPGNLPEGVVKVNYFQKIAVGEELNLRGLYRNPKNSNRLVLEGPGGGGLDSLDLRNGKEQQFQLISELKVAGKFVYHLTEKSEDGKVLIRNPVPVEVEEKIGLKILILNNFPTFETKYLKNFLAEAGHELVVRSQITRGRFKYEYFNRNRTVIGNLSREALKHYDLLIIGPSSLRNFGGNQLQAVQNAVTEDGLGVFIQPDEAFFSSPGPLVNIKFERQLNRELWLEEWPDVELPVFPFGIISSPLQEYIYGGENIVIAGYTKEGIGRIGTTLLSNTWQLILEGEDEVYKQIWSRLVSQVSKREAPLVQLILKEQFGFPHEPFHFKIRTGMENPVITNKEGRAIPLVQDLNLSEHWNSTLWPHDEGWKKLQLDTITEFNFYIAKEGSWNSLTSQNTWENNQRYFDGFLNPGESHRLLDPINPLWFYIMFLLCMGGLWLEPKLS